MKSQFFMNETFLSLLSLEKSVIGGRLLNFSRPARERQNAFKSFHLAVWSPPPFGTHEQRDMKCKNTIQPAEMYKTSAILFDKGDFSPPGCESARGQNQRRSIIFFISFPIKCTNHAEDLRGENHHRRTLCVQNQRKRKRARALLVAAGKRYWCCAVVY
jgi:hypothetical protein